MFRPQQKYHGEEDPRHGGQLHWPGAHGLPFRGTAVPDFKQEELDALVPVGEFFNETFDLSDDDHAKRFRWIKDRISNGLFVQEHIERHWIDAEKKMMVYLEWRQLYIQAPPGHAKKNGSNGNGSSPHNFTVRSS
jgi:hypothetical protein